MSHQQPIPRVVPIGEWTLGGNDISFESRPVAVPGSTVDLIWGGDTVLRVRVVERHQMCSHGKVLSRKTFHGPQPTPTGDKVARDLVTAGIESMAGR